MLHLRCSSYGKVGIASSSRKLDVAMPFETTNAGPAAPPLQHPSGFAPLKIPLFRDRWIASTISSVGTWMQDTAGTWLMTSLTASPLLIALMQTAASLPVLLLGLLAGATADIFDRRKLLIFWQVWMLSSVGILAILTFVGYISPWALLVFTFFISAIWSLLAVVARRDLKQGPLGYGILNGSLGLKAVVAATTLHRLRRRFTADQILAAATFYNVAVLLVLAFVRSPFLIIASLILSGAAWTSTMSTINVSVQLAVPAWVQARALGTYMMTFQGGMALGAVLWGAIAERTSTPTALACAAGGLLFTFPFVRRFRILHGPLPDHTPHRFKNPAPQLAFDTEPTDGPVRISVEYRVPAENYAEFTHAIHKLRGVRLRDGAMRWGIYRDAINPEHLNETFIMESWLDFLRSRERITAADEAIRARVRALHQHDDPPKTTYQIYAREIANPIPPPRRE